MKRGVILTLLVLLVLCLSFSTTRFTKIAVKAPNGYHVYNLDTGLNYTSIQDAIDALETEDGHTVLVEAGTYYENVVVDKAISLIGENYSTTIIDGNMTGHVVRITEDHVNVTGFTMQRSGRTQFDSGISVGSAEHSAISCNRIINNEVGVHGSPRNASISGNVIVNNVVGIAIDPGGAGNSVYRNHLMANTVSIHIYFANSNNITENKIEHNWRSITVGYSRHNRFNHNHFFNNTEHVLILSIGDINYWDSGYPSGGNYWGDYNGTDNDHDGIGDTPYIHDANNTDHYPLMGPFSNFNVALEHDVQTICNSTISEFEYNGTAISFDVTGENGSAGFCRVCIPMALMTDYQVFVNGNEMDYNLLPVSNSTQSYLYFTYEHSTKEVVIIPELPSLILLPLFLLGTLLATVFYRRKSRVCK
jgi:parallel beta-helix repeat protein